MSILFDNAASEYYDINSNVVNTDTFIVSAWIYVDDISTDDNCIFWSGDKDVTNKFFRFMTDVTTGTISFTARNTTSFDATTSTSISTNTWYHVLGVSASATDRRVYLNNGGVGTNTNSVTGINAVTDRMRIGGMGDSTPGKYFSGRIAEFAIYSYDAAIDTASGRQPLTDGVRPIDYRADALIQYRPFYNTSYTHDILGTGALTPNGTPANADHPNLKQNTYRPMLPLVAAAAVNRLLLLNQQNAC